MFEALQKLFARAEPVEPSDEPRIAVAALLVHLAAVDGSVAPEERTAIRGALEDHYGLDAEAVDRLLAEARQEDADSVDFYRFTSTLSALPEEEKIAIVRMMWQVVFADKKNHELEDNMVWRIAELIHVPARERNILRKQMARA